MSNMYRFKDGSVITDNPSAEWVKEFKTDLIAAGLTDEEIKMQLRDPLFGRGPILCRNIPKEKFVELWNSSIKKIVAAGLTYRRERYAELRDGAIYELTSDEDGNVEECIWIPADARAYCAAHHKWRWSFQEDVTAPGGHAPQCGLALPRRGEGPQGHSLLHEEEMNMIRNSEWKTSSVDVYWHQRGAGGLPELAYDPAGAVIPEDAELPLDLWTRERILAYVARAQSVAPAALEHLSTMDASSMQCIALRWRRRAPAGTIKALYSLDIETINAFAATAEVII